MSDNIEVFGEHSKNPTSISVVQLLRETADKVEAGEIDAKKCILLLLNNEGNRYTLWRRISGNMKMSDIVALLSYVKSMALRDWIQGAEYSNG